MSLTTITRLCLLEGCFDVLDNHYKTVFARGLFLMSLTTITRLFARGLFFDVLTTMTRLFARGLFLCP